MEQGRFFLEVMKFVSSLSLHDSMNSLCEESVSALSVLSSNPLFSCAIAFCTLVFLYLPHLFWKIAFSPVLILTWILLLFILRLGAIQNSQHDEQNENRAKCYEAVEENRGSKQEIQQSPSPIELLKQTKSFDQMNRWMSFQMSFESRSSFVEWDVKAPLEVIYEEYEGEEGGEETGEGSIQKEENRAVHRRYPSLSRCYPESDSDSSSSESEFPAETGKWDLPGNISFFRWDDEEDREGLIEIALDGCKNKKAMEFYSFEEENLIEIDISPTRYKDLSGEDDIFSGQISCH